MSQVFQRLRDAKLKLKVKKCSLCRETVQFLGHVVSSKGIAADPAKIQEWLIGRSPLINVRYNGF